MPGRRRRIEMGRRARSSWRKAVTTWDHAHEQFVSISPSFILVVLACPTLASAARAGVTRGSPGAPTWVPRATRRLVGTIHLLSIRSSRNRLVVDLDKAPTNASGLVEFSSDLYISTQGAAGHEARARRHSQPRQQGRAERLHRGASPDPATENDLGDRFLMRFGFTIVWVGWEFDLEDRPMTMKIHVPAAVDQGKAISGVVRGTFTANSKTTDFMLNDLSKYDAVDPAGADSELTVRSHMLGVGGETIPRSQWHIAGHTVTLDSGFEPGKTYTISYRATNPPVSGLGYIAVRDTTSWLKHQPDALAPVRFAYGYGSSQSGRFLRGFLYEGFNTDEHDRQVFDGVMAHIAGASRLSLNERWAKPTGLGT
jgi:hypothetical protein